MGANLIISILWLTLSTLAMVQYAPMCKDLSLKDQFIVMTIFVIGGPFFAIANILEVLLDCILPEGWDDDDPKGL